MKFPADLLLFVAVLSLSTAAEAVDGQEQLPLRISWGHTSPQTKPFYLKLRTNRITLTVVGTDGFDSSDSFRDGAWQTQAGGGRTQALSLLLEFPTETVLGITNVHKIWRDLI